MLSELAVRDLGVIEELSLVFDDGMTAVTGETGAGKTLIVGAIDLLTGGRSDAALVRTGAQQAEIEGRFVTGDDEMVLRRVIPRNGRSRAYVNGHLATVASLAEIASGLVDLHGQHAHQSLLRAAVQRAALDRFGAIDTEALSRLVEQKRSNEAAMVELGGDGRARAREMDLLRHQVAEIDAAAIEGADEDERLERRESELADATAHRDAAARAVKLLDADGAVSDGLATAQSGIAGRAPYEAVHERLADAAAEIADIAATLRDAAEAIDDDPRKLAELRERRHLLASLRRKYGSTLREVLDFRADAAESLARLEGHDERLASLEEELAQIEEQLARERSRARGERVTSAQHLAEAVQAHLRELAMGAARVGVDVDGEAGERVTFLLAANPQQEPSPLARSASGGELARAMLALRLVLSEGPPTLIFDEVDAGVGGSAALSVGRSLAALTAEHQVLVVTHLPQVAAHANCHVTVQKSQDHNSAQVTARRVAGEDRLVELSRMLSGSPGSEAARRHAEELLAEASQPPENWMGAQ